MNSRTTYSIQSREHTDEEILSNKLFNVFVFGLPRSGTSMMTHVCELLGVKMFHTSEEKKRDYNQLGKDYHPNETGFYEITRDLMQFYLQILGTPYSGCKMIIPVTRYRFEIVKMVPSKVIMMMRDPEEIRQSQNAFYSKNANIDYIRSALAQERVKLKKHEIEHIVVNYRDVIENPCNEISRVKEFIQSENDIEEAVRFVNPKAYRFNRDHLVEGI